MFWGLMLEPGKRYSTTVDKSFHISKAALECSSVKNESEILSVILETEGTEALLCNLCKQKGILQESLDLNFMNGDRVTFECRGLGKIHLTGYILPEDDDLSGLMDDEEMEEEEDDEEEEEDDLEESSSPQNLKKGKRKQETAPLSKQKKMKIEAEKEDLDIDAEESDSSEDDSEGEDEEIGDTDDSDLDLEEDEDINLSPKKSKPQPEKKTPSKQNLNASLKKSPLTNGATPKEQKNKKKTEIEDKSPASKKPVNKQKKMLDLGVTVKEIREGTGALAKPGKMVSVYYVGKLKNGQVFDKQMKGTPFAFKLGKEEVIKGWDIGLQGMKVGGKRVIYCPPEAAYGPNGVPPKIPPNSTLIFDVELKGVN